ncbi:hypothetical protein C0Z17_11275 [Trinickia caryophylli]|nr:hypothetical protein C0Z17_11275 [Trinickia caryophylli]
MTDEGAATRVTAAAPSLHFRRAPIAPPDPGESPAPRAPGTQGAFLGRTTRQANRFYPHS